MHTRHLFVAFIASLSAILLLASCDNDATDPLLGPQSPVQAISDGANGGSDYFFFLPPLVDRTQVSGEFNGELAPSIVICELNGGDCAAGDPFQEFGPLEIPVVDEHYQLDWSTAGAQTETVYRITVLLGETALGFADVIFGATGREARQLATDDVVGLVLGSTLPIKFHISHGVFCGGELDCFEGSFTAEGGVGVTDDEHGAIVLSEGWFDPDSTGTDKVNVYLVKKELGEGESCLPIPLIPVGACYTIVTDPPDVVLTEDVVVEICVDETNPLHEDGQVASFHAGRDPEVIFHDNAASFFVDCSDYMAYNPEFSTARRLAQATGKALAAPLAWLVGPAPLRATHLGDGGIVKRGAVGFSDFVQILPLHVEIVEGDGQSAVAGLTLGVDVGVAPKVHVYLEHTDPSGVHSHYSYEGAELTFEFSPGATETVSTDVDGLASAPWPLTSGEGAYTLTVSGPTLETAEFSATATAPLALARFCPGDVSAFQTFPEALLSVAVGGTIQVCDGTFQVDHVVVNKPVTIEPEPGASPVIVSGVPGDGPYPDYEFWYAFNIDVPAGTVEFLGLDFVSHSYGAIVTGWDGTDYDHVLVDGCDFTEDGWGVGAGPSAVAGHRVEVRNSTFEGGGTGTFAFTDSRIDVYDSEFSDHTFSGLQYQTNATGRAEGNTLTRCGPRGCIRSMTGASVEAIGNTMFDANWGIHVGADATVTGHDNVIYDITGSAFHVLPGGALTVNRSDITTYADPMGDGSGLGDSDLTCNWWGSAAGPQSPQPGVDPAVYTPWAAEAIAGNPGVECPPTPPAGMVMDGVLDEPEWAGAQGWTDLPLTIDGVDMLAAVLVMHDGTNLYMAVKFDHDMTQWSHTVGIWFDYPINGDLSCDDDGIVFQNEPSTTPFHDMHYHCDWNEPPGVVPPADQGQGDEDGWDAAGVWISHGGTVDGEAAVINDAGANRTTIELFHPLNSGDTRDFVLSPGATFGLYVQTTTWTVPGQYTFTDVLPLWTMVTLGP